MALRPGGEIPEGINVTPTNPIKELVLYLAGIVVTLALLLWVLAMVGAAFAVHLPVRYEIKLGSWYAKTMTLEKTTPSTQAAEAILQGILDKVLQDLPPQPMPHRVRIRCTEQKNAFAIPGGTIVVFSGLLKKLKSEPMVAMLLAHELGHQMHRDGMRALGRSLAVMAPLSLLGFSEQSALANSLASFSAQMLLLHHSREQEMEADTFALARMRRHYPGQEEAAIELFRLLGELQPTILQSFPSWSLTHPHAQERLQLLQRNLAALQVGRQSSGKQLNFEAICPDDVDKNNPPPVEPNPAQNKNPS